MSDNLSITSDEEREILTNKILALDIEQMYQRSKDYFCSELYLKYVGEKHYSPTNLNIKFEHKFCDMIKIIMPNGVSTDFDICYNDARDYTDGQVHYMLKKYFDKLKWCECDVNVMEKHILDIGVNLTFLRYLLGRIKPYFE